MEIASLVSVLIIVITGVLVVKALLHSARFLFFMLLTVLVMVYLFKISFTEVVDFSLRLLMWVL